MSPCERLAVLALRGVSFPPGIGAKRFARDMATLPEDYELSPRQRWYLAQIVWRYRRQLPSEVTDWALETAAGSSAPPPATRSGKVTAEKKSRLEIAREALTRPLRFGDKDQVAALQVLERWRAGYRRKG